MKPKMLLAAVFALSSMAGLAQAKPIEAVASFTVLADMVQNVGGDHVHVTSLIGLTAIRMPTSQRLMTHRR